MKHSGSDEPVRPEMRMLNAILDGMDKELNEVIKTGDREQIKSIQEKQLAILRDLLQKAFAEITRLLQYSGVSVSTGQSILGLISDTNNIWITITGRSMLEMRIDKIIGSAQAEGVGLTDLSTDLSKDLKKDNDKGSGYSPIILN